MKRATSICGIFLLTGLFRGGMAAQAASLDVDYGQTVVVSNGMNYDSAVVRNGGVLILDGGAIGTNAMPSVNVEAGGRFVVYDGAINYFENRGIVELYGGRQSTDSSENRGYLRIAGGDPGIQIVHMDGTLDLYSTVTNRTAWEIDSTTTNGNPKIRLYCVSNTLAPGTYTYASLTPASYYSFGKVYHDQARFWPNTQIVAQVDIAVDSNWPGLVYSYAHSGPKSPVLRTQPAIQISWASQTGHTYQVQRCTNLVGAIWRNFGLPVYATGTNSSVLDTTSDTNTAYRLQLLN